MNSSQLRRLEAMENSSQMKQEQHIWFHDDGSIEVYSTGAKGNLIYIPTRTGGAFHEDDTFVRAMRGPFGSGKSTALQFEVVRRACAMPAWSNGRRRSRWVFTRNTSGELSSTTLQTWLSWFSELGTIAKREKPILRYEHAFSDGQGIVELEIYFLGIDDYKALRKLKSFEFTGAYINEMSEMNSSIINFLSGRINGRYPSKVFCSEPYFTGIIADTNPVDEDHWVYETFEKNKSPDYKMFQQPPGLLWTEGAGYEINPDCDNFVNFLNQDYYLKLAQNASEGFIKVFCLGEYGLVENQKRVYHEYNDDVHSRETIDYIPELPIHLGWDFGLTPACIVIQILPSGRLHILKEYTSVDMGIRNFANNVVLPALASDFSGYIIGKSECDPAGRAKDQIVEELSCIGELKTAGFSMSLPAYTNDPVTRQGAVRYFLNTMIDGKPALLLSRQGAPILRKGFATGYYYRRIRNEDKGSYREEPNKNEYSHPHDGLQYIVLPFASSAIKDKQPKLDMSHFYNPTFQFG